MKQDLVLLFQAVLSALQLPDQAIKIIRTENILHGDYTTNIAFLLGKELKQNPVAIAQNIVNFLNEQKKRVQKDERFTILQDIDELEVAGPGFINLKLSHARLSSIVDRVIKEKESFGTRRKDEPRTIVVEFAHPNTHKAFHIGHLRNITTGECMVRLLTAGGDKIIRVNYQGDVGMHIAKALYALLKLSTFSDQLSEVRKQSIQEKVSFLGKAYAAGSSKYEADEEAKKQIGEINKKIYAKDPEIIELYQETRQWSLDYFETIYQRVGSHYDRYYFESEVYEAGKENVHAGLAKGIFVEDKGAIIFPGEKFGLHNRVFITGEGNPTYEGKEMGLGPLQFKEYHPDKIIHVVGPEQAGYFQVCFEALAQLFPETRGKEQHLVYGWVKLKHGKMSSRTGNVVLGEWLLDEVKQSIYSIIDQSESKYTQEEKDSIAEACAIAAVKYGFLKVGLSQEISFDIEESINIHGDSGPYLLYAYARCKSVLKKATAIPSGENNNLNTEERALCRLLMFYPDVVAEAADQYAPSSIITYMIDLAQTFNSLYAKHQILDNPFRLELTAATAQLIKNGLALLGIETVERM